VVALFSHTQLELQDLAASIASDGRAATRRLLDGGTTDVSITDQLMAGFSGIGVPEAVGGAGGTLTDAAVFVHGLARQLQPDAYVWHLAAVQAGAALGFDVQGAAAGGERWTLALAERGRQWEDWSTIVNPGQVSGHKIAVPHGSTAHRLLVWGEGAQVAVTTAEISTLTSVDASVGLAEAQFDGAPVEPPSQGDDALRRSLVLLAASLCGVGHGAIDLGAAYATEREQFGRPIGQFQGVSHQLADALVEVESAWNLVLYASWALDASTTDRHVAVHTAVATAGAAAVNAAERTLQVHGGIGVTWEADPHLFLRRALTLNAVIGGHRTHALRAGVLTLSEQNHRSA